MTMSMVGPYLTTTKYNRKQKASKSKRLAQAQSEHETWLKSMGVGKTTLPTNKKGQRVGLNEIPDYSTGPRMTSDRVAGNGSARKTNVYTGDELAGIVTTHKSNLMPVRKDNKQAAVDAASMRR
jgi:hypothetical protein